MHPECAHRFGQHNKARQGNNGDSNTVGAPARRGKAVTEFLNDLQKANARDGETTESESNNDDSD